MIGKNECEREYGRMVFNTVNKYISVGHVRLKVDSRRVMADGHYAASSSLPSNLCLIGFSVDVMPLPEPVTPTRINNKRE